jgi:hypothetical protein
MFLQLKAQAPEVSNDQVIAQAIKALCVEPLHNHLVRKRPKIVPELYELFTKFSKSEVDHFHKLEQQRKSPKPDDAPRPPRYNNNQCSYPKPVHSINSDGCGSPEYREKNFGSPPQEIYSRAFDQRFTQHNQRGSIPNRGHSQDPYTFSPPHCMYHGSETNHRTKYCPIFLKSERKIEQDSKLPL